jgi:hypothetical protein
MNKKGCEGYFEQYCLALHAIKRTRYEIKHALTSWCITDDARPQGFDREPTVTVVVKIWPSWCLPAVTPTA